MRTFLFIFFGLAITYVLMVISHECGHYMAARSMGYEHARIHWTHTDTGKNVALAEYRVMARKIEATKGSLEQLPVTEKEKFSRLRKAVQSMREDIEANNFHTGHGSGWMYAAGPLTNVLCASFGMGLLFYFKDNFRRANKLTTRQWVIVFVALIWFSRVYELAGVFAANLIMGREELITDEYKVCAQMGIYRWTINIAEGIVGIWMVLLVFRFVPAVQKRVLVAGGLAGGAAGYLFWHFAGPVILP